MEPQESGVAGTQELLDRLQKAIVDCDQEEAEKVAQETVKAGLDPLMVIDRAVSGAAEVVHHKFDSSEYGLPQLIMSADAMTAASRILEANLPKGRLAARKLVVIGTVQGDLHTVGKGIVAMMLQAGGFEVHDLGVDVRSSVFIDRARELKADIIALSSLMTTTLPYQRELIETLEAMGLRDQFKVMVGGGPVTSSWAQQIGADGYGQSATEALATAKHLTGL